MSTTQAVSGFESAELVASTSLEPESGVVRVTLTGSADSRVMAQMMDLLGAVHAAVIGKGAHEAVVDFRALDFMNSSCFKAFVTWIARVQDLEPSSQYTIRLLSDRGKHWQRRSLGALSAFASDLVRVET
jgi:hypothetical protein